MNTDASVSDNLLERRYSLYVTVSAV